MRISDSKMHACCGKTKALLYPILSLILLFSFSHTCIAQNETLRFENIGIEEGLSNNDVLAIFQDSKGYMWFGTEDGLNKYDGYSFTKYQLDPFDSSSLSSNGIYTIWEDKYGSIWVGTFEGMCRFDRSIEKFTRFKPSPGATFSDPNITSINEDSDGMIWAGSFEGGLCRFDRQKGIFLPDHFEIKGVFCIYKDTAGTLWVGSSTGLHKINLTAKRVGKPAAVSFTSYQNGSSNPNSLSSNIVRSIFEDHEGMMWLATDNGLNSFDRKTGMFKRYLHDPKNIHSISTNNFDWFGTFIQEDQEGNLWIGSRKGLNKLSPDRQVFTVYLHNPDDASTLSYDVVVSLHIDDAGILYAGTWGGGKLGKANLNPKSFGLRRHDPENINSLSNNQVTAIVEDSAGVIWIGTYGGGLNRWDKRSNQFIHFRHNPANPKTLKHDTVTVILIDRHEHLWICNGDILSQLNKQTGEFTHYPVPMANGVVFSITEDQQGLLWLGTANGIRSFDEKTHEFGNSYYYDPKNPEGISDGTALAIFADSKDNIWIGYGSRATDKYDKKTRRFSHFKYDPHDSTSISSTIVKSFFEDSKGNLWLGTFSGGLCYFDYQKEKFTTFTDKQGLPANTVYSLLTDNKGHLWSGTSNGLSRFDPGTKTFTNYDYKDGLQSNIFVAGHGVNMSKGACFKGKDGTLYFGGNNGFNFFDPQQLKPNSQIAPVVITQFKLFDKLRKGANESKKIILKYNENYFSFEFATLSFYNPVKNQYAYKLDGVDKDWVYSGSRRYVTYTNIDPGTYTFRVKGTINDGVWNEKGTSISIIIRPPWWLTWWAYCFYGACFIAAIFIINRFQRKRVILKERERIREKELEQAHEIEKAYHELKTTQAQLIQSEKMASLGELTAGIAHEIQNPLNFVNNFSEVSNELLDEMKAELDKGDTTEAKAIVQDVKQNLEKILHHGKRADAIVKGMLQHSRSSTGVKEPTDINALADEYLRLSYHGLRAKDKSFNARFETQLDPALPKINVVQQDLGRVILNLINNAFYAVNEKKQLNIAGYEPTVMISTKKIGNKIEIRTTDNGNGIPQKVINKIFQPFFTTKPTGQGTGLGLSLSYDIVKAHGGELNVESKEGEGTSFIIKLPAL